MSTFRHPSSLSRILVVAGLCAFLVSFGTPVMAVEESPMKSETGEMTGKTPEEPKSAAEGAKTETEEAKSKAEKAAKSEADEGKKESGAILTKPAEGK